MSSSYRASLDRQDEDRLNHLRKTMRFQRLLAVGAAIGVYAIILLMLLWTPIMGPWKQERVGMANYRQAKQERKITIEQARGDLAAAKDQAEAIRVMGQAARDYPEYATQQFIAKMAEGVATGKIKKIIYVPVEAPLPVTEAGRVSQ
jgi:hypothetical protein